MKKCRMENKVAERQFYFTEIHSFGINFFYTNTYRRTVLKGKIMEEKSIIAAAAVKSLLREVENMEV